MPAKPRILLGGLFHETNTFLETPASVDEFAILRGAELFSARGDSSPLAGVIEAADTYGWSLCPTVDYRATPSGLVQDAAFEQFWQEFSQAALQHASEGTLDALYLVLHGAMTTQSYPDAEGELLQRIRSLTPLAHLPIFGVIDLHANFTEAMARHADAIVAYQENPHTDARASARRGADLLQRYLETGIRPTMSYLHPPLLFPPTGTATAVDPMRALEARARQIEAAHPHIWEISVVAGFSHADTPDSGVSFVAVHDQEQEQVRASLQELAAIAHDLRHLGLPDEVSVDTAFTTHLPGKGPLILVEPADNIGGGAPGDCTTLLRALVERKIANAGIIINDPAAVDQLHPLPIGSEKEIALGGKGSSLDPGPYSIRVRLTHKSDGRFELEDKNSHLASMVGSHVNMGPCVTVQCGGVTLLITSLKTAPFDLGQWRSQNIEPADFDVIVVKAAVAHRRAYDRISNRSLTVDTPGPCSSNIRQLPYRKLLRPIFPLD